MFSIFFPHFDTNNKILTKKLWNCLTLIRNKLSSMRSAVRQIKVSAENIRRFPKNPNFGSFRVT